MKVYYIKEDKSDVQDYYVGIVLEAFESLGYECIKCSASEFQKLHVSRDAILVLISHYATTRYYLKGYRNIVYWVQGSSPDESFMRNHSHLRRFVISLIELFALKHAKFVLCVSKRLMDYYKERYGIDIRWKSYIMPCFNCSLIPDDFFSPQKYLVNSFCYVGGLSVWQCFKETAALYKKIELLFPNSEFRVFTRDQDKAKEIILSESIANYSIQFVQPNELSKELAKCKYGFIIREKSPVNMVATPTKLSNYLASGVIPIVTDTVDFFNESLSNINNAIILNNMNSINSIIKHMNSVVQPEDVLSEYQFLFNKYYNRQSHISQIVSLIKKLFTIV